MGIRSEFFNNMAQKVVKRWCGSANDGDVALNKRPCQEVKRAPGDIIGLVVYLGELDDSQNPGDANTMTRELEKRRSMFRVLQDANTKDHLKC
jgi:hypothetical protein